MKFIVQAGYVVVYLRIEIEKSRAWAERVRFGGDYDALGGEIGGPSSPSSCGV